MIESVRRKEAQGKNGGDQHFLSGGVKGDA